MEELMKARNKLKDNQNDFKSFENFGEFE